MTHNPVRDIVDFLALDVGLGLTKGDSLFNGPPRGPNDNFQVNSVYVSTSAGAPPQRFMGQATEVRFAIVNIRIRNAKYGVGLDRAIDIQNTIQAASIIDYLDIFLLQSNPVLVGEDSETNPIWSMGVGMSYEELA